MAAASNAVAVTAAAMLSVAALRVLEGIDQHEGAHWPAEEKTSEWFQFAEGGDALALAAG